MVNPPKKGLPRYQHHLKQNKMSKEIKLAENHWTSEYDILEDKGNDYIVVKLHEAFKYHPTEEPCDTFLTKKPK
jgi:hypothetical protein